MPFSGASVVVVAATAALAAQGAVAQPLRGPVGRVNGTSGCTPGDNSFDNLLLVEQWPGTLEFNAPGFTMHGFWPSRTGANVDNYPCQCTSQTFDLSEVQPIIGQLNQFWPSDQGGNADFWKHEFEKHGTCAESIPQLETELKFFQGTLAVRSALDTEGTLAKASINPSFSATYSMSALNAALPTVTILKCNASNFLQEVATCFDKSLKAIDCENDAYGGSNCEDGVHYIPATGWAPSSAPSPAHAPSPQSSDQCKPNEHGPACTTDAECQKYAGCVRCASSGFCTTQPKGVDEPLILDFITK
eukprot:INCI10735.1.p1 GENE.INCI10735.1~~INCI10735.1.p1  ORF type:complete len:303 (-),score=37.80 INCI10735.1:131-1039(-)